MHGMLAPYTALTALVLIGLVDLLVLTSGYHHGTVCNGWDYSHQTASHGEHRRCRLSTVAPWPLSRRVRLAANIAVLLCVCDRPLLLLRFRSSKIQKSSHKDGVRKCEGGRSPSADRQYMCYSTAPMQMRNGNRTVL
ncbi:hypothetical protein N657DRAFT_501312 [Parathielavia appendiculata]|uniref:Uncharacterized protein n=1 Tax=Parathielavia appendiculata TaxID=2587402 RepID=A0AAN6TXI2_9PEZI|nr:hypothetical protein N657DRAFT_501312 [Parathielavia appendiculata]